MNLCWPFNLRLFARGTVAAAPGPFGDHATLADDLVSYWALSEQSGTRADSIVATGNDLTDNNTVGYVNLGPSGVAADFVAANTEYLSRAIPSITGSSGVTVIVWLNLPAGGATNQGHLQIGDSLFSGSGILLDTQGAGAGYVVAYVYNDASDFKGGTIGGGVMNDDRWHMYAATYSDSDLKVRTSLDAGTQATTAALSGHPNFNSGNVWLGRVASVYSDSQMARVGVWNRTLSTAEITSIYATGRGKSYADLTPAEKVGLVSYWNLDEVSGARYDSHGANDLTDNNTVGSVNSGPEGVVGQFTAANSEYFSLASQAVAPLGGARTVALWMKITAGYLGGAVNPPLIKVGPNVGTHGSWLLYCSGTEPNGLINLYANDVLYAVGAGFISDDLWYHVIYTFDGVDSHKVYVDNVEKISATAADGGDVTSLFIGGAPGGYWDGNIGRVGIWSRVLNSSERASVATKRYDELTTAEKVSLVSYWDLTETSGTRSDSHGTNHLTDNNTVTYTINKGGASEGVGASFVAANSEYLSRADDGNALSLSGDKTFTAWVYRNTSGENLAILSQRTSGDGAYQIYFDTNDLLHAYVTDSSSGFSEPVSPNTALTASWNFVVCTYTASDKKLRVQLNNGTEGAGAALTNGPISSTQDFNIGRLAASIYANARIDEVGIWNRVLTSQERSDLFNAGKGLFYGD